MVCFRFRILQTIEYWYWIFLVCYRLEFVLFWGKFFFTALNKTAVPPLFTLRVCEDIAMVEADKMLKHFFSLPLFCFMSFFCLPDVNACYLWTFFDGKETSPKASMLLSIFGTISSLDFKKFAFNFYQFYRFLTFMLFFLNVFMHRRHFVSFQNESRIIFFFLFLLQ